MFKNDRSWLENLIHILMLRGDTAFGLLAQHMIASVLDNPPFWAAVGMRQDGALLLAVSRKLQDKPDAVQLETLKHELLHVASGHFSPRLEILRRMYGADLVQIAVDLSVNQHLRTEVFKGHHDMELQVPEMWNLPKNLTTEEYARRLHENFQDFSQEYRLQCGPGGTGPQPDGQGSSQEDCQGNDKADDPRKVLRTLDNLAESYAASAEEFAPEAVDERMHALVKEVQEAADRLDGSCGRGWKTADTEEFVKPRRRRSDIGWRAYMRRAESRLRSTTRVPSLLRPSRRCPEHYGRKRAKRLNWWFTVDTSGSMGQKELSLPDSELRAMYSRGMRLLVFQQDAQLKGGPVPYDPRSGLNRFLGRGGTDFSPILERLLHTSPAQKPSLLIIYTDGHGGAESYLRKIEKVYGRWSARKERPAGTPDGVRVLWLLTPGGLAAASFKGRVPFGEVLKVSEGDDHDEDL